ncbi:MAG: peptidoglycan editing factor PgeF [Nitrospirae bacterium]|nr:peptidoglycan editing factor PgeF [Nitrospirota bacterium]
MNDIFKPKIFDGYPVTAYFTGRITNVPNSCFLPIQIHSNKIIILDDNFTPQEGDAIITQKPSTLIGVRTADCVPILLYDKNKSIIAAVHAGWRGTALAILKNTISTLKTSFSSDPKDLIIAIGPSIKYCCYKVGQEVIDAVRLATGTGDYYKQENGDLYINLAEANRLQALSEGIDNSNIWTSTDCTYCKSDKYFSYRNSSQTTGRQGGFISLIP